MQSQASAQVLLRCSSGCAPPPLVKNSDGTIPISFYPTPFDEEPAIQIDAPLKNVKIFQQLDANGKPQVLTLINVEVIGFDDTSRAYIVSVVPLGGPEQKAFEKAYGSSGIRIHRSSLFSYYLANDTYYD